MPFTHLRGSVFFFFGWGDLILCKVIFTKRRLLGQEAKGSHPMVGFVNLRMASSKLVPSSSLILCLCIDMALLEEVSRFPS